ncbi:hypothetical protein ACSZNV_12620 [Aeromonas hydrophila]
MQFDVCFRIGAACCGPFPAEAKSGGEMLEVAAGYQHKICASGINNNYDRATKSSANLGPSWGQKMWKSVIWVQNGAKQRATESYGKPRFVNHKCMMWLAFISSLWLLMAFKRNQWFMV